MLTMNRNPLTGYMLLASAFVLMAMILLQASRLIDDRAHAEMVVNKDSVTMITTRFQGDSEILYILDSRSGRLFAYMLNPNTQVIEPLSTMDLSREFSVGAAERPGARPQPRSR
jgi:hypothetical protein